MSYIFHQDNAVRSTECKRLELDSFLSLSLSQVPVTSWFDDMHDTELLTLIPIFERLAMVDDVVPALKDIHRRRPLV